MIGVRPVSIHLCRLLPLWLMRFWHSGVSRILLAALSGAAPVRAERLVLATYNLDNYGPAGRLTEEGFRAGYPKPEEEKSALRRVIRALNADVLGLQEMGDSDHLEELRRDLASEGLAYPYAAEMEAEDADRRLGILSRRPFSALRRHDLAFAYRGGKERVKRGLLEARVRTEAGELALFVVHLKSHLTERDDDGEAADRRADEAAAVRDCVLQEYPPGSSGLYVILGDCNDGRGSPALRRLERRGQTAAAWRLPAADSRGEVWTEAYRRADAYVQLDHILVSSSLRGAARGARIYDGPGTAEASDHRPLIAELELTSRRP